MTARTISLATIEGIAKALTRRLLQDNPGIDIREVSERVSAFVTAVGPV